MMGVQAASAQLFYDFCLDDHVPSDHLLRSIGGHLDLDGLRQTLKPFYSQIGRPSIDPELMIRMLMVGYCMGIRSERRLCEEVHLNLAYRWFCRLGLDGKVPDHSTFSKNRHGRFRESDLLRHMFESGVRRCMAEGWWAPMDLRSTQALSPPTPTSSARFRARTGSLRRSRKPRPEPLHVVAPTPSVWFAQDHDRWLAHVG
jgi:transposase